MTMLRSPFFSLRTPAAVLAAMLLLSGCDGPAAFRATRTAQVAHVAGTPVSIVTDNGSVDLSAAEASDVQITARLRAQTQERLDATNIAVVRDAAGLLSISVDWPGGIRRGNEGCDFEVRLPDAKGVTVESSNGRINVQGLAGSASLTTSNGAVEVTDHDGEVRAHTSNGRMTLRDIRGDARARSTNGAIELSDVTGKAEANTSNGRIEVRLAPTSPGPVFADTSNGAVIISVGPAFAGKMTMRTSNGRISVSGAEASGSKGNKSAVVGVGGPESIIKTSNGHIDVTVSK